MYSKDIPLKLNLLFFIGVWFFLFIEVSTIRKLERWLFNPFLSIWSTIILVDSFLLNPNIYLCNLP